MDFHFDLTVSDNTIATTQRSPSMPLPDMLMDILDPNHGCVRNLLHPSFRISVKYGIRSKPYSQRALQWSEAVGHPHENQLIDPALE